MQQKCEKVWVSVKRSFSRSTWKIKNSGFSADKLALDYSIGSRTVFNIVKVGGEKLANYRIENPDSGMKTVFKG